VAHQDADQDADQDAHQDADQDAHQDADQDYGRAEGSGQQVPGSGQQADQLIQHRPFGPGQNQGAAPIPNQLVGRLLFVHQDCQPGKEPLP